MNSALLSWPLGVVTEALRLVYRPSVVLIKGWFFLSKSWIGMK